MANYAPDGSGKLRGLKRLFSCGGAATNGSWRRRIGKKSFRTGTCSVQPETGPENYF